MASQQQQSPTLNDLKRLEEYETSNEFLATAKNKYTLRNYRTALNHFFRFTAAQNNGMATDPDTMIRKMDTDMIQKYVLAWLMHLRRVAKVNFDNFNHNEIHVNTVHLYFANVKTFFDYHAILLPWKKLARHLPEKRDREYRVYSKEEVLKILSVANPRERVIVLLLASSGIRATALIDLKVKDFTELENGIGMLKVYAGTKAWYITFCSVEATAAIKDYLSRRHETGEDIKLENPLIRDDVRDALSWSVKHPHHISYPRLWGIIVKLLKYANISHENLQPNHAFRKFVNTYLANNQVNALFKEIMIGHSVKLDRIYFDKNNPASITTLLNEYQRAADSLIFDEKYKLKKDIVQLQEKLKEVPKLETIQQSLVSRELEIDAMKKELAKEKEERDGRLLFMQEQLGTFIQIMGISDPKEKEKKLAEATAQWIDKGMYKP